MMAFDAYRCYLSLMKVNQKYPVYRMVYPYAKKSNPILHEIILNNAHTLDKGALMTSWKSYDIKEFNLICTWIRNFLLSSSLTTRHDDLILSDYDLWGQLYNKGSYQEAHDHLPAHWSFVYYVNTPRGSSPLVFEESKKRYYPKTGEAIVFPGWIRHFVPPNKCEGRSIVDGNFMYTGK